MQSAVWNYLQISDALDREFVSALSKTVPAVGWEPVMSFTAFLDNKAKGEYERVNADPQLRIRSFPLQRGYSKAPFSWLAQIGQRVTHRLERQCGNSENTPLICSTPYYAPVAENWRGPVIYYLTDLIAAYGGANEALVHSLDRRMCSVARLVCPNSNRLAEYLQTKAGCRPEKIHVIPNATRESNILPEPLLRPSALPEDAADLPRPIAGVIGNMAGNLNWTLLRDLVERAPEFSWLFVGPTGMEIESEPERVARQAVLDRKGRVRFVGKKPYSSLVDYARGIDVAVLPYMRREPTFSGSSTRCYEHLAACRPMISTRGFEELLHKQPLLQLIDDADEGVEALRELRRCGFEDGHIQERWLASKEGTWEVRAATVQTALAKRLNDNRDVRQQNNKLPSATSLAIENAQRSSMVAQV